DHQANQLVYYEPVNPDAMRLHLSVAREFGVQGGNKSGKTGAELAELAIQMTGVVPECVAGRYPAVKLRAPIRARLVVTSLITARRSRTSTRARFTSSSRTRCRPRTCTART